MRTDLLDRPAGRSDAFLGLVHRSALADPLEAERHRAFIASRMLGGVLAALVLAAFVMATGRAGGFTLFAALWFLAPVAIALIVAATGRLRIGEWLAALAMPALAVTGGLLSGDIRLVAVAWLVTAPVEAALSSDRRMVALAAFAAAAGLVALVVAERLGLFPPPPLALGDVRLLDGLGTIAAIVYVAAAIATLQELHLSGERAIRSSDRRIRLLADHASDLITRHDGEGRMRHASGRGRRLIEVAVGNGIADPLGATLHPDDHPAYKAAIARVSQSGTAERIEARLKGGDGEATPRWVEIDLAQLTDQRAEAAGRTADVVAVTRDISERKAREAELIAAREAAESASLAKSRFLANVSHELRTPLNSIIGFSSMLAAGGGVRGSVTAAERGIEYGRIIQSSGEHLLKIVNDLLDISRIEAGRYELTPEPVQTRRLIAESLEMLRPVAEEKGITLSFSGGAMLPDLVADGRAFRQILINLVANAVKFSPGGGSVRVQAMFVESGEGLVLTVADRGIGIAAKDLARLGEPFVQAETRHSRAHEGAGLGLSIARGLARLHGGTLDIASELGFGTTVTVRLPLAVAGGEMPEETPRIARAG
ncbi:MAG: PAS domain-containing sensor histidine kinase [Hyphomicrobiaceae bacterium]